MGRVAADFGHSAIRRRSNMELWRDKGVLPSGPCPAEAFGGGGSERERNAADGQKIRNPFGRRQLGHMAVSLRSLQLPSRAQRSAALRPTVGDAPRSLLAICPNCLSRNPS